MTRFAFTFTWLVLSVIFTSFIWFLQLFKLGLSQPRIVLDEGAVIPKKPQQRLDLSHCVAVLSLLPDHED